MSKNVFGVPEHLREESINDGPVQRQPGLLDHCATVPGILNDAAKTFAQRSAIYGDNYKRFGPAFLALFPDGKLPEIKSAADVTRLGLMVQIVGKMTRYAENFTTGGHLDSARDMCVYAAMLESETHPK